ncbi:hypothetical protein BJ742DRAFT_897613 [Cladochytrium replicatum]|nr:hypothetical protein BJ742DRAFT_897613 [Cladochytrium replicatum]
MMRRGYVILLALSLASTILGQTCPAISQGDVNERDKFIDYLSKGQSIGQGFNSLTGAYTDPCLVNDTKKWIDRGQAVASIQLDRSQEFQKSVNSIRVGVSVAIKLFFFTINWSIAFATDIVSTSLSDSVLYSATYTFPSRVYDDISFSQETDLTDAARDIANHPAGSNRDAEWRQQCGDQFIYEQVRGAKLYIGLKVGYASPADRVSQRVSLKYGGSDAQSLIDGYTKSEFSDTNSVKIGFVIRAIGGSQETVNSFLTNSTICTLYTNCLNELRTTERAPSCQNLIAETINWGQNVFAKSITPENSIIVSQRTLPYRFLDISAAPPPREPSLGLRVARDTLETLVDENANTLALYAGWRDFKFLGDSDESVPNLINETITNLKANVETLKDTYNICWDNLDADHPEKCIDKVNQLRSGLFIPPTDVFADGLPGFALNLKLAQTKRTYKRITEIPSMAWGNTTKPSFSSRAFTASVYEGNERVGQAFVYKGNAVVIENGPLLNRFTSAIREGSVNLRYGLPIDAIPFLNSTGTRLRLQFNTSALRGSTSSQTKLVESAILLKNGENAAFALRGVCFDKYFSEFAGSGKPYSDGLGFPISEVVPVVGQKGTINALQCRFENGFIFIQNDNSQSAPLAVFGDIYRLYVNRGGTSGYLGFPVKDTIITPSGGFFGEFSAGALSFLNGSEIELNGVVLARYRNQATQTLLGLPTSKVECNSVIKSVCVQTFETGALYYNSSATDAVTVIASWGDIFRTTVSLGFAEFGIPSGDPTELKNENTASFGIYQDFAANSSVIFASNATTEYPKAFENTTFVVSDLVYRNLTSIRIQDNVLFRSIGFPVAKLVNDSLRLRQFQRFEGAAMFFLDRSNDSGSQFIMNDTMLQLWNDRRKETNKFFGNIPSNLTEIPQTLGWPLAPPQVLKQSDSTAPESLQFFENAVVYDNFVTAPVQRPVEREFYAWQLNITYSDDPLFTSAAAAALFNANVSRFGYPQNLVRRGAIGDRRYLFQEFEKRTILAAVSTKISCDESLYPLWCIGKKLMDWSNQTVKLWLAKQSTLGLPFYISPSPSEIGRIAGGIGGSFMESTDRDVGDKRNGVIAEFELGYLVYYLDATHNGIVPKLPPLKNVSEEVRGKLPQTWYTNRVNLGVPVSEFDSVRQLYEFGSIRFNANSTEWVVSINPKPTKASDILLFL